jgi:Dolichyl-phosphate-mannose-protein mannosyltransferase
VATDVRRSRPGAARQSAISPSGWALPRWPAEAWGAIGITTLFLGLSWWWVTRNQGMPVADAGFHLQVSVEVFRDLQAGHLSQALEPHLQYPPFMYLVNAVGIYIGGVSIPSVLMAENLFFVPLLALGCYQLGRLAFGRQAGLLAVLFALSSPLLIGLFHLALLDGPQAAMAAVGVWLILATDYFKRLGVCAVAGLAVALGMLTKESLALFVIGPLAVTVIRGGWRNWQGLFVFGVVLCIVAGPWYINDYSQVQAIGTGAANSGTIGKTPLAPPRFSSDNLQWYAWSLLGNQLFLPLFLLAMVGWVWTLVGFIRKRWVSPLAPELALGAFVAWFGLTQTFVHDNRYGMSLLLYAAVFGSFWIVRLPRPGRIVGTLALVSIAIANTLTSTFGVGGIQHLTLPHALQRESIQPNFATIYSNEGYLVPAAPYRGGDMLATLKALKQDGVKIVLWLPSEAPNDGPYIEGLVSLTTIANLEAEQFKTAGGLGPGVAVFDHEILGKEPIPPCVKLPDGTAVWIRRGNPFAAGAKDFCPAHKPQFYTH